MKNRGEAPQVNAGSMADIAFLLLIFFLVTTSMETDAGLDRMLPPIDHPIPPLPYQDRNILRVRINQNNVIMVEKEVVALKDLRTITSAFLDNGGAAAGSEFYCDYCQGKRNATSSDHPIKAVVSLGNDRETNYATYIAVQNELVGAYNQLRNREAVRIYGEKYTDMEARYSNPQTSRVERVKLKDQIKSVQQRYPQKLSEATIK